MSWLARGDVIQRVNRIFTADDTVLAGGVAARKNLGSLLLT